MLGGSVYAEPRLLLGADLLERQHRCELGNLVDELRGNGEGVPSA